MSQIDPKQIQEDATYFLGKLNIGASFLDARAFQIMNNNLGIGDMLKEIGDLRSENIRLKSRLKFDETHNDPIRLIRILRKCGFPPVANPNLESNKDQANRNLWYFKAAMFAQE